MKLYIHGGLNKTGSSYLQVLLETCADDLRILGISYADSQGGYGNAAQISHALRRGRLDAVQALLVQHYRKAEAAGCESVLLSTEHLYHDIVVPERRLALLDAIFEVGFERPHLLLFFRNPVDHAISCFCHRSGVRDIKVFEDWVSSQYEFPAELRLFFATIDTGLGMALTALPYEPRELTSGISRWLDIATLPDPGLPAVNRSVNTYEARLLSWLRKSDPAAAIRVRDRLKVLDLAFKHPDKELRAHWRDVVVEQLAPINPELTRLSELLGAPMELAGECNVVAGIPSQPDGLRLSEAQLKAVVDGMRSPPLRDTLRETVGAFLVALRRQCRALFS